MRKFVMQKVCMILKETHIFRNGREDLQLLFGLLLMIKHRRIHRMAGGSELLLKLVLFGVDLLKLNLKKYDYYFF